MASKSDFSSNFWTLKNAEIVKTIERARMHFKYKPELLNLPFLKKAIEFGLFELDNKSFFTKLRNLQLHVLEEYNNDNLDTSISVEELIFPGLALTNSSKEVLYLAWGANVPQGYDILKTDLYSVYSGSYLYRSIGIYGIFPLTVGEHFFYHDLIGHSLGHVMNPLYTLTYRRLSSWVLEHKYSNLTEKQKDMLNFFNEDYYLFKHKKTGIDEDVFTIVKSLKEPKFMTYGYSWEQNYTHLSDNFGLEKLLVLAEKTISFAESVLVPAGGVSSELHSQRHFMPPQIDELIEFLRKINNKKPNTNEVSKFLKLLAKAQVTIMSLYEFNMKDLVALIKSEDTPLTEDYFDQMYEVYNLHLDDL